MSVPMMAVQEAVAPGGMRVDMRVSMCAVLAVASVSQSGGHGTGDQGDRQAKRPDANERGTQGSPRPRTRSTRLAPSGNLDLIRRGGHGPDPAGGPAARCTTGCR